MKRPLCLVGTLAACCFAAAVHGAVIAILDSGANPTPVLAPFLLQDGFDFVNGDADARDDNGHGSTVAEIAVRAAGSGGVRVLPLKVMDDVGRVFIGPEVAGIDFAASRQDVRILNLSFGGDDFSRREWESLQRAVQRDKLVVMAAGNSAGSGPVQPAALASLMQGRGIAVGAVDAACRLQPYSNRAGTARDFFLVAPDDGRGTSFAAPRVSGAAARVLERDPHLSAGQVGEILFSTATDLGAPGVDAVYGHGLVNAARALQPLGPLSLPSGSRSDGPSAAATSASLRMSAAAAHAILDNGALVGSALVLDRYARSYSIDLTQWVSVDEAAPSLADLTATLSGTSRHVDVDVGGMARLRMEVVAAPRGSLDPYPEDPGGLGGSASDLAPSFSLRSRAGGRWSFRFDHDARPGELLGPLRFDGLSRGAFVSVAGFAGPYFGSGRISDAASLHYGFGARGSIGLAWFNSRGGGDYGLDSEAAVIEAEFAVTRRADLRLQFGRVNEDRSLLGGAAGGPLGVASSQTVALGLAGRYRLGAKASLFGHYTVGLSDVAESRNSLWRGFSTLRHESFGFGVVAADVGRADSRLGVAVTRPVRIARGSTSLVVPRSRDAAGNVYADVERIDLSPQGEELDVELFYRHPLSAETALGVHVLHRHEPYHSEASPSRTSVLAGFSKRF